MQRRIYLATVLLLGLWLSIVGVASGLSADPGQPEMLSNAVPASGTIEGNRGGAFAY